MICLESIEEKNLRDADDKEQDDLLFPESEPTNLQADDVITVDQFARMIRQHLRLDNDCVIAVTSTFEGMGKSTCAAQLGKAIDKKFGFERNVLFSPTVESMKHMVANLPKYSVIDADEAIRILYKMKWGEKITIFLNQLYAICRQENLATILPMPRIQDFVEFWRNHKIKFWVFIVERGVAVIFFKDWNPFAPDPWYIKENFQTVKKYRSAKKTIYYSTEEKLNALRRCTNFVGILRFDDLQDEDKIEYNEMKRKFSYADLDIEGADVNMNKIKAYESVDIVLANRPRFVRTVRRKQYIDLDRIMLELNVGRSFGMMIKKLCEDKLAEEVKQGKTVIPIPLPPVGDREMKRKYDREKKLIRRVEEELRREELAEQGKLPEDDKEHA